MMTMDVELGGVFHQNDTYDYENYENSDTMSRGSEAVFISVLYLLESVVGLLGNGLLMAVLAQKRRSWRLSDTFVFHLSVADVLLLVTLPFRAAQAAQLCEWCFDCFLCKINRAVFHINFYCGIGVLVCISLDHYLSIVHAIQLFSQKSPRLAHIICLLVWLSSVILAIPDLIFIVAWEHPVPEKTLCTHNYSQSGTDWQLVSRLPHHMLGFLLPTATLIICSSLILLRLQHGSKGLQRQRSSRVILYLVVVFFLCWLPYNITLIVDTIRSSSKETNDGLSEKSKGSLKMALMVTSALGCIHACLRPLLYLGLCTNFRERTLATLRRATVESKRSLWELGVGEEALPDQSHEREELKQMKSVDHQVQSTQC